MSALNPLACILESNHLIETNFKDWPRNLKIILILKKLRYILDQDPSVLSNYPNAEQRVAFDKWIDEDSRVKYYLLASLSNELQSQYEHMPTAEAMITHL